MSIAMEPRAHRSAVGIEANAKPVVNDLVVTVATSNGTGSQSANLILMRAIFGMGIPVSGKNMFR